MYFRDANGNIFRQKPQPKTTVQDKPKIKSKIENFGVSFQSGYGLYVGIGIVLIVIAVYMIYTRYGKETYPKRFGYKLY